MAGKSGGLGSLTLNLIANIAGWVAPMKNAEAQAKATSRGIQGAFKGVGSSINSSLGSAALKVGGLVAALGGIKGAATKLLDTQRSFDVLNAGLITSTGSAQNAAIAYDALLQFAQQTPYGIEQAVSAFNKLVNLGLTPSEEALMSYGNTASAMGKDLEQMIEAVADATTGEFERLKEFGIKSKSEGDKVSFTFRGVTTTIGKNAREIEQYLMNLGKVEFAGAMENRMSTLDGAIAGLADSWDVMWKSISDAGIGDLIGEGVEIATGWIESFTDLLKSGAVTTAIEGVGQVFEEVFSGMGEASRILGDYVKGVFDDMNAEGDSASEDIFGFFTWMVTGIIKIFQKLSVVAIATFDRISAAAGLVKNSVAAIFTDGTVAQAWQTFKNNWTTANQVQSEMMDALDQQADRQRDKARDTIKTVQEQIEAYKKAQEEAKKAAAAAGDQLAAFGIGGDGKGGSGGSAKKGRGGGGKSAEQKSAEDLQKAYDDLIKDQEKRLYLIRNTGKMAQFMYELERGELSKLTEAQKEFVKAREQEISSAELTKQFDEMIKDQEKRLALINATAASAELAYDLEHGELKELAAEQKALLIGNEERIAAMEELRKKQDEQKQREEEANKRLDQTLDDLKFQLETVALTREEYEKQYVARQFQLELGREINDQERERLGLVMQQMDALHAAEERMSQIEDVKRSLGYALMDVAKGTKSIGQAFDDMISNIYTQIMEKLIKDAIDKLFKALEQASVAGVGGGGFWSGIMGAFGFGGKQTGGYVPRGTISEVNEAGLEMARVRGKDYLLTGGGGAQIIPAHAVAGKLGRGGGTQVINFAIQGKIDRRTQEQIATQVYRQTTAANARNL